MTIRPELLDELLKDYQTPQDLFGDNGILKQLTKGMIERCLQAEMEAHLGYPKHGRKKPESANTRNGSGQKTLKSEPGELEISVPRDRDGSFEPILVKKRQSRLEGLEEKILALYARGMTTRDIQAQLQELYGVEVSPTFISNVTQAVMEEVRECAESAPGGALSHSVCGLPGGQSAREPAGDQQGRLPGVGGDDGGAERTAGHVDGGA
jgi:putative transposase